MKRITGLLVSCLLATLTPPVGAQKRAITVDDYLALKSVGNPQLSPDGKWVAYTVTEPSLKDNRGITRIWLAEVASGSARPPTPGAGSGRAAPPARAGPPPPFRAPPRESRPAVDDDVPTIATGGDGDVSVSPDGKEIAVAMHGDTTVADNTNVDVYIMGPDGSAMRALTTGRGADNTPRYSPDGKWLAYLSMERAGVEADRQRLMLVARSPGRPDGPPGGAPTGWARA